MKIAIITYPCTGNYGGMLQVYASSLLLHNAGHDVSYLNLAAVYFRQRYSNIIEIGKLLVKHTLYMFGLHRTVPRSYFYKSGDNFRKYIKANIVNEVSALTEMDAFFVGSDQIWRDPINEDRLVYFLSFSSSQQRRSSFSYAASFGMDEKNWGGGEESVINTCRRLLREFKAVSVREHSGVNICKDVFGVDAVQMPDPTLLLHTADYGKIIDSEKTWQPVSKYVAAYVLDETDERFELLQESAETLNLLLQHLMPHANAKKRRDRFPISVPQWLRLIRDCEYFITDSFHGCVFANIFNKPFVCLGNEGRGNARFDTLLGTFGLEDRLVTDATPEKVLQALNTPIDWARVNAIHDAERERGINFLKKNLSES